MKSTYIIILLFFTASCNKDWLDVKADDKLAVPSTLQDFQGMLDDAQYMNTSEGDKGEIASDGHYISDQNYSNAAVGDKKDAYTWSKTTRHVADPGTSWANIYKKVLYCNIVLEGVENLKPGTSITESDINNIKGQALFQRAFAFFQLSQLYTPPITPENENQPLGIIIRTNTDITIKSKRATIKETYDRITTDLEESTRLLPQNQRFLTRATRVAAFALLSRVYLYLGEYEKSKQNASDCLLLYSTLLNYNNIPSTQNFVGLYNPEVLFHASMGTSVFLGTSCFLDSNLINTYDKDDLRKKVFFRKHSSGNYIFKGNYFKATTPLFCGLAVDEVYLNRAECFARTGKITEAVSDLNILLKSRWDSTAEYKEITASNPEEALNKVLIERNKSLLLRGIRWMDLRRLNQDSRFKITITRTISGQEYKLEPNSYKYAFPFPDDVIEQTGVSQNLGWEK